VARAKLLLATSKLPEQSVFRYASLWAETALPSIVNAVDLDGDTALMHAAWQCTNGKIVGILLEYGAAVNVIDYDGESALTIAAFNGDERAVRKLVAAGADLNVTTGEGETALTIARDREIGRKKSHDRIYAFLRDLTNH
jgi:ankyrin repeat protein